MAETNDIGRETQRLPNQIVTPTSLGCIINAAINVGSDVEILPHSCLNETLGILKDESVGVKHGRDFYLRYFGVGIGGSRSVGVNGDVIEIRKVHQHKATDNALFRLIPLVARDINDDLDPEERKNYRGRVVKVEGSKTTVFYYLRLIDLSGFNPVQMKCERNPQTGQIDSIKHIPVEGDLKPTPFELSNTNSIPMTDQYITATGRMDLSLNANELQHLRNVSQVLFGDASLAAINEYGIFYGIETMFDGQAAEGGTINYKELISMSLAYTITESHARDANTNNTLPRGFNYGSSQPLLFSSDNG